MWSGYSNTSSRNRSVRKNRCIVPIYAPANCEFAYAPKPQIYTLFAPRALTQMDQADRVRAVYLHACLRYVQRESMTNSSLRERFGIDPKNSATASRLIKEALNAGVVRLHDPEAPPKLRRYVPDWA